MYNFYNYVLYCLKCFSSFRLTVMNVHTLSIDTNKNWLEEADGNKTIFIEFSLVLV